MDEIRREDFEIGKSRRESDWSETEETMREDFEIGKSRRETDEPKKEDENDKTEKMACTCGNCNATDFYPKNKKSISCRHCHQVIIPENLEEAKEIPAPKRIKQILLLNQMAEKNPDVPQIPMALGIFYLTNGAYQYALPQFKKAVELDPMNADAYYYTAVSLLGGVKPFIKNLKQIQEIVENLNLAEQLEPKAVYYYLHAYVAYDYYKRKFMGCNPSYSELLSQARASGITAKEIADLFELLKTDKPTNF